MEQASIGPRPEQILNLCPRKQNHDLDEQDRGEAKNPRDRTALSRPGGG